jgi:hypothetical protein
MARAVRVIADSDEESDVEIAPSPTQQLPALAKDDGPTIPDIDLGVNFSDFLSQSQDPGMNASQQAVRQQEQGEFAEKSTGTTASLKRQIESEQRKLAEQKTSSSDRVSDLKSARESHSSDSPIVARTRRRQSELASAGQMDGARESKRRRQNTYGSRSSSSRQLRSSQSDIFVEEYQHQAEVHSSTNDAFDHALEDSEELPRDQDSIIVGQGADSLAQEHRSDLQEGFDVVNPQTAQSELEDVTPGHPAKSTTSGSTSAFKDYVQLSSGRISTTRSLMGNHESINLNFSGSGQGLDINTNPFGDPSQQSAEENEGQTDKERVEAIFRRASAATTSTVPLSSKRDTSFTNDTVNIDYFPQNHSPSLRMTESSSRSASGRSKSYVDPSLLTMTFSEDRHKHSTSRLSSTRKRRKTDDGLAINVGTTSERVDDVLPPTDVCDARPSKSAPQGKKRGRKPKNHVADLDTTLSEQPLAQNEYWETSYGNESSPGKNPSSELHLDDESATGLPHEQYKPRPSRSRSKRTDAEEMPPPAHTQIKPMSTPDNQISTPNAGCDNPQDEQEDTPLTKLKKEKRKKNKMKRAKTSAAALLKKSDKMLSDGEEDVVWLESKPAAVNMKVPDPVQLKEEVVKEEAAARSKLAEDEDPAPGGAEDDDGIVDTKGATENEATNHRQLQQQAKEETSEISVDVPQAVEQQAPEPPKKRGRKRKKTTEIVVNVENEQDPAEDENTLAETETRAELITSPATETTTRKILREKNVNTSHTNPCNASEDTTSTLHKPADSQDLPSSSKRLTANPSAVQTPQKQPPATPHTKDNDKDKASEKGPTKHSPINPAGGKVKYRVGLSRRAAIPPLLKTVRK